MKKSPESHTPRWLVKLLALLLDPCTLEASLGDLEEKFQSRIHGNVPSWKAKFLFVMEGLGFLRMTRLSENTFGSNPFHLIRHTFLFFSRLVMKDLGYYLVSLLGLTLSLTAFMFIMMFIHDELSYDQFHVNKNRLYRLTTHLKLSDIEYNMATSAFPAAAVLQSEVPEVELAVRVFPQELEFALNEKKYPEHIVMADEHFFEMFSFTWLSGDQQKALTEPASIVLTKSMAEKYFGMENPVGQTQRVGEHLLTVTGVIEDVPKQSHLRFDAIIPLQFQLNLWKQETGVEGRENKWYWIGAYTYVLLQNQVTHVQAETKLPLIVDKYFPDRYKQGGDFHLQPVSDIHLNAKLGNEMEPPGNLLYVRLFSIVAVVIMVVCAINLINLTSFKISSRMREVGIRKLLGQNTVRIIAQLSAESTLIGVSAFCLALVLCDIFINGFNNLVQKELELLAKPNILIEAITLVIIVAICLAAVVRPAIRYASKSSHYLLYQKAGNPGHAGERNVLIGLQVCFSFVLLVFSFIVSSQIDFFKNKDTGFDKENLVLVELNDDIYGHEEAFKNELKKSNSIVDVSGGVAPGDAHNGWRFVPEGGSEDKPFLFPLAWVDHDYLNTLKIKLLQGENFSSITYQGDSLWPFVINKQAALELGFADEPIHKKLKVFAAGTTDIMAEGQVIGLIDDYHFESLHNPVKPVILTLSPWFGTALIRISGNSPQKSIAHIKNTWTKFSDEPIQYEFLDDRLDKLYANEVKLSDLISFFTFIALYLTCYGMFALSSLLFRSRLKEVSIRKVFGADYLEIIRQFYSRYAVFTLAAIAAGIPISIYVGSLWLQTFEYRIDLVSSFFVKAGACVLMVGLLSVSYYLMRVAFSNPVQFLRNE